uniref:Uncharacterized protein n=1 Tax=Calcidiscus leptoporus TaxID=127549 RepID=A0A7S0IS26_9EUKA|mmetsp:Transcript_19055/g.43827  ORF Transcript_19055/g.43827 Transcript_19055/m.43827 type:complete len:160 (+) Transcript_19055:30-509(+)
MLHALMLFAVSFQASPIYRARLAIDMSAGPMTSWAVDSPEASTAAFPTLPDGFHKLPDEVKGVVAPSRPSLMARPSWQFRHGTGSASIAASPAIDGSVAMRIEQSSHSSRAIAAPSEKMHAGAEKSWPGASGGPADVYEFCHGTGGRGGATAHYMSQCL